MIQISHHHCSFHLLGYLLFAWLIFDVLKSSPKRMFWDFCSEKQPMVSLFKLFVTSFHLFDKSLAQYAVLFLSLIKIGRLLPILNAHYY
jgi:hypothetical protein